MNPGLWLLAGFASAYLGFASFALSQPRHWKAVVGAGPPVCIRCLRGLGTLLLAASLAASLARDGASFGALLWVTLISLAAFTVALTVSLRPRLLRPLALAGRRTARSCILWRLQ